MPHEWLELTRLTTGQTFNVTSVRLGSGITIQGEFEPPPLARLSYEDQVFVSEFIRSHGSIKDMEKSFGVSYPTVKNRLNRIADQLRLVVVDAQPTHDDVLGMLERGEITPAEAEKRLRR